MRPSKHVSLNPHFRALHKGVGQCRSNLNFNVVEDGIPVEVTYLDGTIVQEIFARPEYWLVIRTIHGLALPFFQVVGNPHFKFQP